MKTELIIGAFKEAFPIDSGVYNSSAINYAEIYNKLVIAPRFTLENNPAVRHLINYDPMTRWSDDKKDAEFLVYQRPDKGVGEKRLSGDYSIGFGGHVEYDPAITELDKINDTEMGAAAVALAVHKTSWRENNEELKVINSDKKFMDVVIERQNFCLIIDNSNDVGLHHVGISVLHQIRNDVELTHGDDEGDSIKIIGWFTIWEIKELFFNKLENWSKMLVDELICRNTSSPSDHT